MTIGFHKVSGPDFTLHPAPNWLPQQDSSFCLDPAPTQLQPGAALNPKGIAATPSRFGRRLQLHLGAGFVSQTPTIVYVLTRPQALPPSGAALA
ncbi:hypothetical protein COLO4_33223 [Corchorus olitorius]|uniref:Uncharacterized protein n=1 Tax=Corchorus olitorius TaxID=93759 RepID=A0A1R3GVI0_9ROSI|nr:hypothetical protein COLO4_33223 [Corchorus olitorius]